VNEDLKKRYLERYHQAKQKGVKFFPDIIYKDLIVSFAIFIVLIMLATFVGVANEPKADPADTAYIPRPEWYFLFLFEMLKYFPGQIEWIGTAIIPGAAVLALFLLPFIDRNPYRHFSKRKFAVSFMSLVVVGIVALTIMAVVSTPPQEEAAIATTVSEQIPMGSDLYSVNCVECHGAEGEGGEIKGVEGLEGVILAPINARDVMYTLTDDSIYNIINYGQPDQGMTPFGRSYGGELSPGEIESIVTFMRYTWDDRSEIPANVSTGTTIPALAAGEVPSYEKHMKPLFTRYCVSCHRPGKKNNNYIMGSYEEVMTSGDNAPVIVAGDMNSLMIRLVSERVQLDFAGPMPPNKALKQEYIDMIIQWVMAGAPNLIADAAAASGTLPLPAQPITSTVPLTTTLPLTTTVNP
jgi:menaquinol-cytochrome c reductase cytochrome b/c subunit